MIEIIADSIRLKCSECQRFMGFLLVDQNASVSVEKVRRYVENGGAAPLCPICYRKMDDEYQYKSGNR
jgi:hypothetical protein